MDTKLRRREIMAGSALWLAGSPAAGQAPRPEGETILAFGAHPADVLGGCGATLLKHARRGQRVVAAPLTAGIGHLWKPAQGLFGRLKDAGTERLKTLEQARAYYLDRVRQSYAELKPVELRQLDLKDSPLTIDTAGMRAVAELIREIRPSVVLTHHSGAAVLAGHPDHRDAGELVLRAIMFAMEETFQDSKHPPHIVSAIYCYPSSKPDRWQALGQSDAPNVFVDVSTTADAKEKAWLPQAAIFGLTKDTIGNIWKANEPGYPKLEAFVRMRPVVVDYLQSNPGRPWQGA